MTLFPSYKSFFYCLKEKITTTLAPDSYIIITNSNNKAQQSTNNLFVDTPMRKSKEKAIYLLLTNIALVSSKDKNKTVN